MSLTLRPRASALASLLASAAGPPARPAKQTRNQAHVPWNNVSQEIGELLSNSGRAATRQTADGPRELRDKLLDRLEL
jgi:hypothetical protein